MRQFGKLAAFHAVALMVLLQRVVSDLLSSPKTPGFSREFRLTLEELTPEPPGGIGADKRNSPEGK